MKCTSGTVRVTSSHSADAGGTMINATMFAGASLIETLPSPLPLSSVVPSCAVSHRQIKSECPLIFSHCFPPFVDCVRGHKVDKRIRVGVSYPLR